MEKSQKGLLKFRIPFIVIIIGSLLLMSGCGGKTEIEDLIFIMGLGVDKGTAEGTYLLTMQSAQPKTTSGSSTEIKDSTISIETPSLALAGERINESFNKVPFPGTVRVIVLGEEVARSGINEVIDFFQRYYQYRRTVFLLIAKGEAKDILGTKLRSNEIPALSMVAMIEGQEKVSVSPVTRLGHYLTINSTDGQNPLIPIVEKVEPGQYGFYYDDKKGKEIMIHRAGLFEEGKMISISTDKEAKGYLWLDDSVKSRFINAQEKDGIKLSGWITKAKTKYKVEEIDGRMGIKFIITADMSIREVLGQQKQMNIEEWNQFLKGSGPVFAEAIQEECEAAVAKIKSCKLDFVGIGRKIEIKKPKYWREVKDNWQEELVDFPVAYDIKVDVEHGGLVRSSPTSSLEK